MSYFVDVIDLQRRLEAGEDLKLMAKLAAETALSMEGVREGAQLSVVFVDDESMRRLNREYRRLNRATDVLAFPMTEGGRHEDAPEGGLLLGDVVISLERAACNAERNGNGLEEEVRLLVVHGVLHILGYDHSNKKERGRMRRRQEEIIEGCSVH